MPADSSGTSAQLYDISPAFPIDSGLIQVGHDALALMIRKAIDDGARRIALDGYGGVHWDRLQACLDAELRGTGLGVRWCDTARHLLPEGRILEQIGPFLGAGDPVFGRLYDGELHGFFNLEALRREVMSPVADLGPTIVYGAGAALAGEIDLLLYVDVPKDEIQRRMRAGSITNLGAAAPESAGPMYKRFYFVDWPVLNRHKAKLLPAVDWFVDGRDPNQTAVIAGDDLRRTLTRMAFNYFRVRPWFWPGPWGGQFMKQHFRGLDQEAPNFAWSYELIVPENGLVLDSGKERFECSFDLLMYQHHAEVLGHAAGRFGHSFPIRFDYLDTMDGGNLSIQCHPRPAYIRERFGEPFTQDETYYIVTCKPGARVYLGFRSGIDPGEFRRAVEASARSGSTIEVDRYVNSVPSHPHDLFLIPNGSIHGSGKDNLVLEISATPYIYTFKIYDWVRRDLQGNLRPLHIGRAWDNLYFDRQEEYVRAHLCPQPRLLRQGEGWQEWFLGTHEELFYAVHRYELQRSMTARTEGRCHVLNLVEGDAVVLETARGATACFHSGETFVVPAAAEWYRLIPASGHGCKVICAFVK